MTCCDPFILQILYFESQTATKTAYIAKKIQHSKYNSPAMDKGVKDNQAFMKKITNYQNSGRNGYK